MNQNPGESQAAGSPRPSETQSSEAVWSYRGYKLRPSEFTTAMVHYFRAEISRANVWRQRLDTTTNWAVVTTGAVLTFSFGQPGGNHTLILLNIMLVTLFLWIEARRYRYYELWSSRVRLLETDFFAAMLVPPFQPAADWAESLAESLLQPHFPISIWEALGRRLRRNFLAIYFILLIAWFAKLWLHPVMAQTFPEIIDRAVIGKLSGVFVISLVVSLILIFLLLGILTIGLQESSGEVLPRYTIATDEASQSETRPWQAWFRHPRQRRQLLAMIVTDQAKAIADRILNEMSRGVTGLPGTGMYSGQSHTILLCALTVTEVNQLKAIVSAQDPKAFVIISPAQGIFGQGFSPLRTED